MKRLRGVVAAFVMSVAATVLTQGAAPGQQPQPPADPPMPAVLQGLQAGYCRATAQARRSDWLMIRRTYDGWGYSPLIRHHAGERSAIEAGVGVLDRRSRECIKRAPLVNSGVMFVTSPNNQVIAIDVKSGNLLWRYRRPLETGMNVPHQTNRGVALYGDKVFFAAGEAVLVALDAQDRDAKCGRPRRRQQVGLLHDARAARGRRRRDGGRVRRRVRHPRFRRRLRRRDRQREVAHLHRACSRRAGKRDMAEGRSVEDRRRAGLGHGQLRSGDEPRVLGNGQRRTDDRRSAPRRQPLRDVDDRARCCDRRDQGLLTNITRTIRGTGTRCRRRSSSTTSATDEPSRA